MPREYSVQGCSQWVDGDLQCGNGVSWIDITDNKGYCESCAKKAHYAIQKSLRHVWYGEPYIQE